MFLVGAVMALVALIFYFVAVWLGAEQLFQLSLPGLWR
jgi:hypothetical protein